MIFYREAGELIFGSRLKRISERFLMDVSKIYKSLNIPFEVSWFPLFYLLNERGKLSVTEIARELEITHSAVSQLVTILQKKKLILFLNDKNDKRKRLIHFTQKGRNLMNTISPVWDSMRRAVQNLFSEGVNSTILLTALDELEESMERVSVYERLLSEIRKGQHQEVEIFPYEPKCKASYKNLILNWFIENENTKVSDVDLINNPDKEIQQDRAVILMAKAREEWIGTIVVQKNGNGKSDIKYLVVDKRWQNNRIEEQLKREMIRELKK